MASMCWNLNYFNISISFTAAFEITELLQQSGFPIDLPVQT